MPALISSTGGASADQAMKRSPFLTLMLSSSRMWHSASSRTSTVIHGR